MAAVEQQHIPQSIDLEGTLGIDARISGGHAFGQLTDALTIRLNQEPKFNAVLQGLVDFIHSNDAQNGLRFNSKKHPELLSEELLGKFVGLAAEYTLLDVKEMPDEVDGARWIALDGEVARLEDAILLAHRGKKSVSLDERFIRIIADPSGDTQKRIADSLDEVTQALSATTTRAALKVLPIATVGAMIFSSSGPKAPTITPEATIPAITQPAQTTEIPGTPRPIEIPTPKATLVAQSDIPACGGFFPALEATEKPYDYTVGGLASIASDCNAMGGSSGTLKVFSFGPDTELPANIDTDQAQEVSLSLTAYGLDFQAFPIEESWTDMQGREYPNGLIMVVPDGFGIASGFGATVPPGGYFLVTFDKATGSLVRYQLFQILVNP